MLLNPYIAGNPLKDGAQFFGREDILREVMQMLQHPEEKAIVLFGQRRIGKTTILLQLVLRLTSGGDYTPVFFDLQDRASAPLKEVLYKLAQTICVSVDMAAPPPERFDEQGVYFQQEFLPEATRCAAPGGLVILFDEFDVMDSPQKGQAGQAFFPYLRACLAALDRVKFIFVIGRRPEELSTDTLSTFKGIRAAKVSLLDRASTEAVIRQSEAKDSLIWSDEAVERVWSWTQGHTYCTQLVCSVVWERLRENISGVESLRATVEDVDRAIPEALKSGANAFHWIWDGLPPAERVVMAAMAEVKTEVIHQEDIESVLNRSGVRLVVRELKLAPATLVDWELLRPVEGGFRFAVPLLREWVRTNRPLTRTKEELDRLDPLAENLYRSGQSFYSLGKNDEAGAQLRQALTVNPNHLKSRLLLGRILLEQGEAEPIRESVRVLEEAYRYDASAASPDLVKALLASAALQEDEDSRLGMYDRILSIQPGQPAAAERLAAIVRTRQEKWRALGEQALQQSDFARAIQAFENAGATERIEQVRMAEHLQLVDQGELAVQRGDLDQAEEIFHLAGEESRAIKVVELRDRRWVDEQLAQARLAVAAEDWEKVTSYCNALLERHPEQAEALELVNTYKSVALLAEHYQAGIEKLAGGYLEGAQEEFVKVIQVKPGYKRAAKFLEEIVRGVYSAKTEKNSFVQNLLHIAGWLGLAAVIQYLVFLMVVSLFQIFQATDFFSTIQRSIYLLLTALPAAVTILCVKWIDYENFFGEIDLSKNRTLLSGNDRLPGKLLSSPKNLFSSRLGRLLLYALILFISFLIIYLSLIGTFDFFSNTYSSYFYNYPESSLAAFLQFSLVPTAAAYFGLKLIRAIRNPRIAKPLLEIPPKLSTVKAGMNLKRISQGFLLFAGTAVLTVAGTYNNLNSLQWVVVFLWIFVPSGVTYFVMRAIVRRDMKQIKEGK